MFGLTSIEAERLANRAGLSMDEHENALAHLRVSYRGSMKSLYSGAQISERMFRYYKTKEPTKQVLLALAISMGFSFQEMDDLLHKYGYCLSESLAGDMVVIWYLSLKTDIETENSLLMQINLTLYDMELPLLMTRPQ